MSSGWSTATGWRNSVSSGTWRNWSSKASIAVYSSSVITVAPRHPAAVRLPMLALLFVIVVGVAVSGVVVLFFTLGLG